MRLGLVWFGRGERQRRSPAEDVPFRGCELLPIAVAVDLTLARFWRHCPQALDGILHCPAALRRELLHLRVKLPRRVFLLRCQVPPGVHAMQHLLPLLGRQSVETIKLILQMLLLLRWKLAELGIVLQRPSLLFRRQILMLAQPLSRMTVLLNSRRARCRARCRAGYRAGGVFLRMTGLSEGRNSCGQRQSHSRDCNPSGYELHSHFSPFNLLDHCLSESPDMLPITD